MKASTRMIITGFLALAPVAVATNLAVAQPVVPGNPVIPMCCAVRGDMTQKPNLPTVPARHVPQATLAGRKYRRGRVIGPSRGRSPQRNPLAPSSVTAAPILSDPAAYQGYVREQAGTSEVSLLLEGLHCGDCIWILERAFRSVPGVVDARVALTTGRAWVRWRTGETDVPTLLRAVQAAGYGARPYDPAIAERPMREHNREWLTRLAVAGFGATATMFLAEPMYYGQLAADDPMAHVLRFLGMVAGTATGSFTAWPFLQGAWAGLIRGRLGMEVLISLGILATFAASLWGYASGQAVYFDSLTMFLFLLTLGRWAEASAKRRVFDATEHLLGREAPVARLWQDGKLVPVPASSLAGGQLIELYPGDQIPADGMIERGATSVDESLLTGESRPVAKRAGETVTGRTFNLEGAVTVRVTRIGEDATFSRLEKLVQAAEASRTRAQRLADTVGHWGTLAVLGTAAATFAGWLAVDPVRALPAATAVLIITCPCALGLAIPAAHVIAVARALTRGVLFRRSEALEGLLAVRHVVFDKTGTLTAGEPEVLGVLGDDREVVTLAALLEAGSEHPLAKAVLTFADRHGLTPDAPPDDLRSVPGQGLVGTVAGKRARVGRLDWLEADGLEVDAAWRATAEGWMAEGRTVSWVAQGDRVLGAIATGDRLRPEAEATVRDLREAGLGVTLLTGDNPGAARVVAERLGITDVVAGVLPEGKLKAIEALRGRYGAIAMVGDGLNDAPALAAADVGIAMARGADLAVVAADVVVLGGRLSAVTEALALAREAERVIRGNFWVSAAYNAIAIPLAVAGLVTPLLAAILMPLSSLAVLGNTLRLKGS